MNRIILSAIFFSLIFFSLIHFVMAACCTDTGNCAHAFCTDGRSCPKGWKSCTCATYCCPGCNCCPTTSTIRTTTTTISCPSGTDCMTATECFGAGGSCISSDCGYGCCCSFSKTTTSTTQPTTSTTVCHNKSNPWTRATACCGSATDCVDRNGNCVSSGNWAKADNINNVLDYCDGGSWITGWCVGASRKCLSGCIYTTNTRGCNKYSAECPPYDYKVVLAKCPTTATLLECTKDEDCPNGQCCNTFSTPPQCKEKGTIISYEGKSYLCDPPEGFVEVKDEVKNPTKSLSFFDMIISFFSHFFKK